MRLQRTPADTGALGWPTWPAVARLAAILIVAVLVQTTVAPNIRILGANPDFALITIVCVALLFGAETGAIFGFLAGALGAVALMEPLGLTAFVFVIIGFLVGRYAETADLSAGYAPLISAFVATLLAGVLLALAQFLLAREVPLGFFFWRVLVPGIVLNTLLAAPIYIVVRAAAGREGRLYAAGTR